MSAVDLLDGVARAIVSECGAIADLLVEKNRQYGNSALKPIRLFSRADAIEQIKVRIDDKLSRLQSGQDDDTEDTELDLLGYLVLLRVARRMVVPELNTAAAVVRGYTVPPLQDGDKDPVVHVVPDKSSRATLVPDVVCTACGHRFFSVSENGRRILETGVCFACKDLVAYGPPVQIPPKTVLPLKQMPDECLGALCGRNGR